MTTRENAALVLQYVSDGTALGRASRRAAQDVLNLEAILDRADGRMGEIMDQIRALERKLCRHEWGEWSHTYSQEGSRQCKKCEAIERG